MAWKAALTFACINLKKLSRMTWNVPKTPHIPSILCVIYIILYFLSKRRPLLAQRAAFVYSLNGIPPDQKEGCRFGTDK